MHNAQILKFSRLTDTCEANVESVDVHIDQWKCFEEGVVDAIDKSAVDVREEHRRIFKHNLEWLDEGFDSDLSRRHIGLIYLRLGLVVRIASKLPETFGSP